MTHRVAVLPGDGVGPEVIAEARKAVDAAGLPISWTELPWGSAYWHEHGRMMPADALDTVRAHEAVLMGAVGDPSVPEIAALEDTCREGPLTRDVGGTATTAAVGDAVAERVTRAAG